jgi:geranylgeranyl diphosphate synthase type II
LAQLLNESGKDKVQKVMEIFKSCGVDEWAKALKNKYLHEAMCHLEELAVPAEKKQPLKDLAAYLMDREQ